MARILITGSRDWADTAMAHGALLQAWERLGKPENPVLVSGACPSGADAIAEDLWQQRGWPIERHTANWESYGRSAGPIRNQQMVNLGADYCVALILNRSKGASHTLRLARNALIPTTHIAYDTRNDSTNIERAEYLHSLEAGSSIPVDDLTGMTHLEQLEIHFGDDLD